VRGSSFSVGEFFSYCTSATGANAPPRSRQASGLVPEASGNTTSDVAAVPGPAILIQDSEESDHVQPDSKVTLRPVAKTQRKGKAKAGDSKRMTPWGPPEMGGVDFNLNLQEAIENLEPGQLLSPGQVYSSPEWHGLVPEHPLRDVRGHICV